MRYTKKNPLRVGTDCSGIEAPIQALKQLKIPLKHVFSSEIDKYCIQSIKANYEPDIIFGDKEGPYPEGDITKRDINDVPGIDLYIAGFPCQPFSIAGKRQGFAHKSGNVFWSCLEVIKTKQPKYFILENVRGLLWHDKENKKDKYGRTWNVIWTELQGLEKYGYQVQWKVLNTKDYGIPQNRERVYIVGTRGQFEWPEKVEMDNIKKYVDWEDNKFRYKTSERLEKYISLLPNNIFIELQHCSFGNNPDPTYSQCLTANTRMWCNPLSRYITCKEMFLLQGMTKFKQVVSNTQMKKQIGNSMSVNVIAAILANLY
jgi:DNA (cytosine-5)-methyltransferase 1